MGEKIRKVKLGIGAYSLLIPYKDAVVIIKHLEHARAIQGYGSRGDPDRCQRGLGDYMVTLEHIEDNEIRALEEHKLYGATVSQMEIHLNELKPKSIGSIESN